MICPNCQSVNRDIAKVCAQCGKPLATLGILGMLKNRYRILHQIGQGGMGAVYLAEDTQLFGKHLVVKELLLPNDPAERREAENNFRREAELLANLRHYRIPEIYEYFVEQGKYYLTMELAEGENLEKRLARNGGRLSESEVVKFAIQVCEVLVYLANQNPPVIHRDIKPANIIVDKDGQIRLVDFGIARAKKIRGMSVPNDSETWGTAGYAPPEQYDGKSEPRSDIHALGATMHHLLTGVDPRNMLQRQFAPINSIQSQVSLAISQLVEQMLDQDVSKRPTAAQVLRKLQAIDNVQPLVFSPTESVYTIQDLVTLCDQKQTTAIQFLKGRHIEDWLTEIGRPDLAIEARNRRVFLNTHRSNDGFDVLEEFLHILSPNLPTPTLSISPTHFDLVINRGGKVQVKVQVQSNGRSVDGTVEPTPYTCFTFPNQFECRPPSFAVMLPLTFEPPTGVSSGAPRACVIFKSRYNRVTLDIDYTVISPPRFRSGIELHSINDLVSVSLRSLQLWDDAVFHLGNGDLGQWLNTWGRADLAVLAIRFQSSASAITLIDLLSRVDPTIAQSSYSISRTQIDLGLVPKGVSHLNSDLVIKNTASGVLAGSLSFPSNVFIAPRTILCLPREEQKVRVQVDIRKSNPDPNGICTAMINFSCNAQSMSIPVIWRLSLQRSQSVYSSNLPIGQPNLAQVSSPTNQSQREFPRMLFLKLLGLAPLFAVLGVFLSLAINLDEILVMFVAGLAFLAGLIVATTVAFAVYYSR